MHTLHSYSDQEASCGEEHGPELFQNEIMLQDPLELLQGPSSQCAECFEEGFSVIANVAIPYTVAGEIMPTNCEPVAFPAQIVV